MEKTLEKEWQKYLKLSYDKNIPPANSIQYIALKRAFFGACGQLLVLMRDDIASLTDDETVEVLYGLWQETDQFWINECKDYNGGKK